MYPGWEKFSKGSKSERETVKYEKGRKVNIIVAGVRDVLEMDDKPSSREKRERSACLYPG